MMATLAITYSRPGSPVARTDERARRSFLADAGRFCLGDRDVFQQYAAKYVGISRGIPLSNSNQLWGLLWGTLVLVSCTAAVSRPTRKSLEAPS